MRRKVTYDPGRDYYAALGVDTGASAEEIRRAYRRRAREVHPDLHPDRRDWATAQFQLVNEAYHVLRHAGLRRDYDRARWPHASHRPRPAPGAARQARYDPDPSQTWWEVATAQSARQAGFMASAPPGASGDLAPAWRTLLDLWRTPYAGLLSLLAVLLAANLALIVYMAIAPGESDALIDRVEGWFGADGTPASATPPAVTATPDRLARACDEPGMTILTPARFDTVGDTFSVYGTVRHSALWSYQIELGYLGRAYDPAAVPATWAIVRPPPESQSVPEEPVADDLLAEAIPMTGRAPGYYVLRLHLTLRNGSALTPCDVVIRY